jgi:hypothetical protein
MAKKNKYESCMFCGDSPCSCNKAEVKPKPIAARSVKKESLDFTQVKVAPKPSKFKAPEAIAVERDLSLESALSALLPILSKADRHKVEAQLAHPVPPVTDRAIHDWRARNDK